MLSRFGNHYSLSSQLFSCQLITFANSLDPVRHQQNVGSDLDSIPISFFENLILIKSQQMITNLKNNLRAKSKIRCRLIEIIHGAVFVT